MSRGATLQRRTTTYLISLTLVKLEAVSQEKSKRASDPGPEDSWGSLPGHEGPREPKPGKEASSHFSPHGPGDSLDGLGRGIAQGPALSQLKPSEAQVGDEEEEDVFCSSAEGGPCASKRQERSFQRQDAMWISTSVTSDCFLQSSPGSTGGRKSSSGGSTSTTGHPSPQSVSPQFFATTRPLSFGGVAGSQGQWGSPTPEVSHSGLKEAKAVPAPPVVVKEARVVAGVKESARPPELKEKPRPPELKEKPRPLDVEKTLPAEVKERPRPPEVKERPRPPEVKERPRPPEVKERPRPPEVKEKPKPLEVERPRPLETKENLWAPDSKEGPKHLEAKKEAPRPPERPSRASLYGKAQKFRNLTGTTQVSPVQSLAHQGPETPAGDICTGQTPSATNAAQDHTASTSATGLAQTPVALHQAKHPEPKNSASHPIIPCPGPKATALILGSHSQTPPVNSQTQSPVQKTSGLTTVTTHSRTPTVTTQAQASTIITQSRSPTITAQAPTSTVTTYSRSPTVTAQAQTTAVFSHSSSPSIITPGPIYAARAQTPTGASRSQTPTIPARVQTPTVPARAQTPTITTRAQTPTAIPLSQSVELKSAANSSVTGRTQSPKSAGQDQTPKGKGAPPPATAQAPSPEYKDGSEQGTPTSTGKGDLSSPHSVDEKGSRIPRHPGSVKGPRPEPQIIVSESRREKGLSAKGSSRRSWHESERKAKARAAAARGSPRGEGLLPGNVTPKSSLSPSSCDPKGFRKGGKSKTLDNSDLHGLSEDLKRGRDSGSGIGGGGGGTLEKGRASTRDRKMLKFISGIFAKNTASVASSPVGLSQRELGEESKSTPSKSVATSQEWALSRSVPELRVGVVGNIKSAKSALVHRFVTGSYMGLETPESAQFKKEVVVDGQSHLLLIREEAEAPDAKFASWVDAVILVFSLENEGSFQDIFQYYTLLANYRGVSDIVVALVGTQDKINSNNKRVVDDARARALCGDMKRCMYYETCATYGLNVDRVFNEVAQKIVTLKKQQQLLASCKSLPSSPSHSTGSTPVSGIHSGQASNGGHASDYSSSLPSTPNISHRELRSEASLGIGTPSSLHRGAKRRTSLFTNRRGSDSEKRSLDSRGENTGSGRTIPIKQSFLLKRSGNSLNKEWKKKYVTLSSNGVLFYHPSINDYIHSSHGKEMDLLRTTVKVPGKRPPRAISACGPSTSINGLVKDVSGVQLSDSTKTSPAAEALPSPSSGKEPIPSPMVERKKHRRKKSVTSSKTDGTAGQADAKRKMWKLKTFGSLRNIYKTEEENFEFIIVSSTGQSWHFEASSFEERDSWVQAIESQILASLQCCESSKNKARMDSQSEAVAIQAIRNSKGNAFCVDCDAPNPTWASLNLGALICIECSGIHRNLGTHLSRVRSLDLDDWPLELTLVLTSIGNEMANSIWERNTQGRTKPTSDSSREERESWIRAKYEQRLFLPPLKNPEIPLGNQLYKAVLEKDLVTVLVLLAHSSKEQINLSTGDKDKRSSLHVACQLPHVVITQLLVWYGVDVKARDAYGHTALYHAKQAGSQECVDILLQHGCPNDCFSTVATPILRRKSSTASMGRTDSRTALV